MFKKKKVISLQASLEEKVGTLQDGLTGLQQSIDREKNDWKQKWQAISQSKTTLYEVVNKVYNADNITTLLAVKKRLSRLEKYIVKENILTIDDKETHGDGILLIEKYINLVNISVKSDIKLSRRFEQLEQKMFPELNKPNSNQLRDLAYEYINLVKSRLVGLPPDYAPAESVIIEADDWIITSKNKFAVAGEYSDFPLKLSVIYSPNINPEKIILATETAQQANKQVTECFVVDNVSKSNELFVTRFRSNNYAPLLFDIQKGKLYYNQSSPQATFFAGYFDPKKEPNTLYDIVANVVDGSIVNRSELIDKLGIGSEGFNALQRKGLVRAGPAENSQSAAVYYLVGRKNTNRNSKKIVMEV